MSLTMKDVIICLNCADKVIVSARKEDKDGKVLASWTELCPICMPTNKYDVPLDLLQNKTMWIESVALPSPVKIEIVKSLPPPIGRNEDEWGADE